jgi:hypothetical protein
MGRQSLYTAEIAKAICERLASGETLNSICEDEGMPASSTVRLWVHEDREGFAALSVRAYEMGCHAIADDCIQIADDARNDWMERRGQEDAGWIANGEHIQRSRLRIETRMRLLGKWAPKVYGDKVETTLQGPGGGPVETKTTVTLTAEDAYKRMLGG